MYINIQSLYDIVSMAKRFHIGFHAKCKKCDEMCMCCIFRLEEEAFWATSWQNQQNDLCAQRDSDHPGHPPSLIRVFAVRSMGSLGPSFASGGQRRLWSDWADAQADLSLRWVHRSFCWFCHAVARFSYWNHFWNHCVWHCNEFAYA